MMFAWLRAEYSAKSGATSQRFVARALDVEGDVGDTADGPPAILDAGYEAADATAQRCRLHVLTHSMLTERKAVLKNSARS
jgi:hypothetical protein